MSDEQKHSANFKLLNYRFVSRIDLDIYLVPSVYCISSANIPFATALRSFWLPCHTSGPFFPDFRPFWLVCVVRGDRRNIKGQGHRKRLADCWQEKLIMCAWLRGNRNILYKKNSTWNSPSSVSPLFSLYTIYNKKITYETSKMKKERNYI